MKHCLNHYLHSIDRSMILGGVIRLLAALVIPIPITLSAEPTRGPIIESLDGPGWLLATDPTNVGKAEQWWNEPVENAVETKVPWVIQEPFPDYHGVAWYWRRFDAPRNPHADGRTLLRFWSVGYKADVWLNGIHLGSHEGADTPLEFDINAAVKPGESNLLAVRVVDPTHDGIDGLIRSEIPGGNVFPHAGIEDSVELHLRPAVYLDDVFVRPDFGTGIVHVELQVHNSLPKQVDGSIDFDLSSTDATDSIPKQFVPGRNRFQHNFKVANPRQWDLDDPFLYILKVRARSNESNSYDEEKVRFGFRDFRVKDGYFRLNGRRIYLRCAHTGQQDPIGIRVPSNPEWPLQDLRMMKAMGFNSIRFFQALGLRKQLELADEIGFLVIEEPRGGWLIDYARGDYERRRDNAIREMILRDRNHPCIVIWGLLNESPWSQVPDDPVFAHAKRSLQLIRDLDKSRMVLLNSGRWDGSPDTGSISNPGSNAWQRLLGIEREGAEPVERFGQPGGHWPEAPALPIAGYIGGPMGDIHLYPRVPHTRALVDFLRTIGAESKNVYISEYGIASAMDLPRMCDLYEQHGYTHVEYARKFRERLDAFMADWNRWRMAECFDSPDNYFQQCYQSNARQRLVGINAIRSNPHVMGYSLTSAVDTWSAGEGVFTMFREEKSGMPQAISDGFARLRWCLFAEPRNLYRGNSIKLEAILASEDALPPGKYVVKLKVAADDGKIVFAKQVETSVEQNGKPPLAWPVFSKTLLADWPQGRYRLDAEFENGPRAAGQAAEFYIADAKQMPGVERTVALWGDDPQLLKWLANRGIPVTHFNRMTNSQPKLILVSRRAAKPGGEAAFAELVTCIENGSRVLFISPEVFSDGTNPTAYVPLINKGVPVNEFETSCVYPKDIWAKQHPIFEGMPAGGVLDYTYYRELFADKLWQNQDTPAEAIAGAMANSSGYYAGLRIGVFQRGKGKFIINTFRIRENIGTHPAAERLLRNMLRYLADGLQRE